MSKEFLCVTYDVVKRVISILYHDNVLLIHVQSGMTPLYIASEKGHGAVVKLLLEQHADISISTKTVRCKWANIYAIGNVFITQNGWTPLMTASFEGHADIVQTLIEAKAQVNTQDEV